MDKGHKLTNDIILNSFKNLNITKKSRILDLGAGRGELTQLLKDKGYNIYATDFNKEIFKGKKIPFKEANFNEKLPYQNEYFDLIIAKEIIEHMKNPWIFMDEIHRILKPKKYAIITTPNTENVVNKLYYPLTKRIMSFGKDLNYYKKIDSTDRSRHLFPCFHFLFLEMIYTKFTLLKRLSNNLFPLPGSSKISPSFFGLSKIYIIKKK